MMEEKSCDSDTHAPLKQTTVIMLQLVEAYLPNPCLAMLCFLVTIHRRGHSPTQSSESMCSAACFDPTKHIEIDLHTTGGRYEYN
jgi:hypothetical protein